MFGDLPESITIEPNRLGKFADDVLDDDNKTLLLQVSADGSALAANTDGSKVSISDLVNLAISGDTSNPSLHSGSFKALEASDLTDNYDGSNRLGNTSTAGSTYSSPGTASTSIFFNNASTAPITLSVLQALMCPQNLYPFLQDNQL